ncbi:PLD nuclease N-terminal domain-containing protein [Auritidibacter ignavus]|uniref:PLD nuclease N-terminal domain-containing protein n=1 Tax=Auritidibacter ignavus TaxID=678932 RepID=UPI0024B8CA05|nr:PLD nuclease N-terminal domain-containing protein [Auritidibacter ignavus]WHS27791.1 PLD nuclease N-terminal domain-containing protein [Auritidibacter ignavus]
MLESALWWIVSILVVVVMVWSVISLLRSPLEPQRRIVWVVAILLLPVLGSLVWAWWRLYYYPRRKAETPDWDPNRPGTGHVVPRRLRADHRQHGAWNP